MDYNNINVTATDRVNIDESPSVLIHRLHINEKQLRTLAVVLSLAGGLALSFLLGVGILIYWYSRRHKEKNQLLEYDKGSFCLDCIEPLENSEEIQIEDENMMNSTKEDHLSKAIEDSLLVGKSSSSVEEPSLLPPPPIPLTTLPEPSAPTEKEIYLNQQPHQHTIDQQESLCEICSIPPPAYTKD